MCKVILRIVRVVVKRLVDCVKKSHIKVSVALMKLCREHYNFARMKITNSARTAVRWWREVVVKRKVRAVHICYVLVAPSSALIVVRVSGIGVVVWASESKSSKEVSNGHLCSKYWVIIQDVQRKL